MATKFRPKNLRDQVIVITGSTSGIGMATALTAAKRGAKVVLASRSRKNLDEVQKQISNAGGTAIAVQTDVSRYSDVENLAETAVKEFGRIDTWVNNAGSGILGYVLDHPLDEAKQLMETNFWGMHYGCKLAVQKMRAGGGVIVNVGSGAGDGTIVMQTLYSATKHAIKGYTEGVRTELEYQNIPVRLSLVMPASVNTPYTEHAVNHLDHGEPALPWPIYDPDIVANAILHCAETAKRDVFVGAASKAFSLAGRLAPVLLGLAFKWKLIEDQKRGTKRPHVKENESVMHPPQSGPRVRGDSKQYVLKSSLWTTASLHPVATTVLLSTAAVGLFSLLSPRGGDGLSNRN